MVRTPNDKQRVTHPVRHTLRNLCAGLALSSSLMPHHATAENAKPLATVHATVETVSVPSGDDAADDPAIWIHPHDPAQSLVIGTDKGGGLAVFDLDGNMLQYLPDGKLNNVDVRYDFPLAGKSHDLVVAGNRTTNTMAVYTVDADSRKLAAAPTHKPLALGIEVYGSCLYKSPFDGAYHAFFNSKEGEVEQWKLTDDHGHLTAERVRTFDVGGQTEGCVADDDNAVIYIGEEERGIWKFPAEAAATAGGQLIHRVNVPGGPLTADVEGLTLTFGPNGTGLLIASSQGSDTFAVFRRGGANEYLFSFRIGSSNGIDAVTGTDGIDATPHALGPRFPHGVFVAQDDENDNGNQNFKLVPLQELAAPLGIAMLAPGKISPR